MLHKVVTSAARRSLAASAVRCLGTARYFGQTLHRMADNDFNTNPRCSMCSGGESALPSFSKALFKGEISTDAVYPFPDVLPAETKQTLQMLIDPVSKFFEEVNDAAHNDETASVPENVSQGLREMGAFGLQVPEELGGIGLTNSGYARMVEIVGTCIFSGLVESMYMSSVVPFVSLSRRQA